MEITVGLMAWNAFGFIIVTIVFIIIMIIATLAAETVEPDI
jgi:hypothetical protein